MNERAAFLIDYVLPQTPVRQWVLSLPFRLRYLMAYDAALCNRVLNIFVREVARWYRFTAKAELGLESVDDAKCGSVTFIQRFDSGLRLNVHFHMVALDGIFTTDPDGRAVFCAMPAPTDEEVAKVAIRVRKRVLKLIAEDDSRDDPLAEQEPLLAHVAQAAIANKTGLGPRAGRPTQRLYVATSGEPSVVYTATRCVNVDGFSLHANVRVKATERKRLEKLIRYVARSPISNDRLRELPDGRLAYDLKRVWSDGTRAVVFDPLEFIERLLPLVPPPRVNQVVYHGVLAPRSSIREQVVSSADGPDREKRKGGGRPKNYCWAELMRRAFGYEVLVCSKCGGKMSVIATIMDRETIKAILSASGHPADSPPKSPPRPSPQGSLDFGDIHPEEDDSWDAA